MEFSEEGGQNLLPDWKRNGFFSTYILKCVRLKGLKHRLPRYGPPYPSFHPIPGFLLLGFWEASQAFKSRRGGCMFGSPFPSEQQAGVLVCEYVTITGPLIECSRR